MKGKELKVSDQSFNSYNFSVVTAGLDWSRFDANPLMLFNHQRAQSGKKDDILPIGKWEGRRIDGEDVYLTPVFDEADTFAAEIGGKYERGFLNGGSLGILPLEFAAAPEGPNGERRIIIKRGLVMECSVCDMPSNPNTVQFYDANEQPIDVPELLELAASTTTNVPKITTSMNFPKTLALLNLATGSTDDQMYAEVLKLQTENASQAETIKANKKADSDRKAKEYAEVVELAVKDGRIPTEMKAKYLQLMTDTPELGREIIKGLPKVTKLSAIFKGGKDDVIEEEVSLTHKGKTYMELFKESPKVLKQFKADDPEGYEKFMAATFADERGRQE